MKRPRSTTPATGSHPQVLQTLAWLEKNGFKAVPLHKQSKAAINRDYVKTDYHPPQADHWRRNDHGIGIVCGPLNSGPVDFDLDCEEAVFFAPFFLPSTNAVFGRAGKRRSHYLFRVSASSFEKLALGDPVTKGTIVEARGDGGHQTVLPGSIHESSGELVEWDSVAFPDVIELEPDAISKALRKIAIATLLVRYAWGPGTHNETTKNLAGLLYYLEWPLEETEHLITALMEFDGDDDKSRIPTVRATYRRGEAGKKIAGAGVFRKQLNNDPVVDKIMEWAGSSTVNLLQEYNDRFAVVAVSGKFRIAETDVDPSKPPMFYQKDDWLNLMATDKMEIEVEDAKGNLKIKSVPKAIVWLNSDRRRSYKDIDFLPGDEESTKVLNLWTGWAVAPDPKASCEAFLELLRDVVCGGDDNLNNWMLHWFANIIREPMNKSLTAPVIIGKEGAGKSLMVGYFGSILGNGYTVVTNEKHIHGQFNNHMATTLLLHSEEALYGGDRKHASVIRSLITDKSRIHEMKNIDARSVKNFLRLILLSNLEKAAPVMPGDRRYTVIDMKKRMISDDLLQRVIRELSNSGPAALLHHLQTMDYDPMVPRVNVKNDSLAAMKAQNLDPVDNWWYETLLSGDLLPDRLKWASLPQNPIEEWPRVVGSPALTEAMRYKVGNRAPNETTFALRLNRMVGVKLERARRSFNNDNLDSQGLPQAWGLLPERQYSIINLPDLATCRKAFEAHLGQPLEWPAESDDHTPAFMKKDKLPHEKY